MRISDAEYRKQKEQAKAAGLTVSESLRQRARGLNAMSKLPRGAGSIFSVPGSKNLWVGDTNAKGQYVRESCGSPKKNGRAKLSRYPQEKLE